jgi:hypothetical protein
MVAPDVATQSELDAEAATARAAESAASTAAAQKLSGDIVQTVVFQTGAVATGTTLIPLDDTIPQITEGDQYMSVSITPTSALSTLEIEVVANMSTSNGGGAQMGCALFQDSTANALKAVAQYMPNADLFPINFSHSMVAGSTSPTTFRVRCGTNLAGTTTFNGISAGRIFGGVMASFIRVREIKV